MQQSKTFGNIDFITILLFLMLVIIGWINIYSASLSDTATVFFDFSQTHSKQLVWIGFSVLIIFFVLGIDAKFYERFSSLIYLISLVSLVGLFFFGKTVAGQTGWYDFGGVRLQPSEFVKITTALALAKFLSDIQTNIKEFKDQLRAFTIIAIPAILILLQPDPGSAMIYLAFIFPLYREGLHFAYLFLGFFAALLFVATLSFGSLWVVVALLLIALTIYLKNRKRRPNIFKYIFVSVLAIGFSLSVDYVFENVFKQHHRDRFNIVLGKEADLKGVGYNTHQSEIAIGSGGWTGKGWTEGTQTKGSFVPEQHTDYIFSTVAEEWGFIGSFTVIILFLCLILRIIYLSEKQSSIFNRVYGYSVAAVLFVHFFINIGMVVGLLPTVGIPLPFLSYGGSSLWGFTILLFIFIRLDGQRHIHG